MANGPTGRVIAPSTGGRFSKKARMPSRVSSLPLMAARAVAVAPQPAVSSAERRSCSALRQACTASGSLAAIWPAHWNQRFNSSAVSR